MLSSSAASCIVERGSALIIALSWSLSTSSSQLLCWSSNALATWCEELTHLEKTLMLGRIEGRRRRGRQRMRWHHWLDGHEFEQAPGVGDGQGSLVYCSPWGCKESDTTEWLNWLMLLIFKALVSFAKLPEPLMHCTFISNSWAKCIVDVARCHLCFMTHFELE